MIYNNLIDLIGSTPLVKINKLTNANVLAKIEYFNPTGSIKDRAAMNMIITAIKEGKIDNSTIIIEPTSGNTGIGLAMVCAILGFRLILTMPETMSKERRNILRAYGAELVLTQGNKGMQGSIDKALELNKEYKNSFIPQQFDNPSNPLIHYMTTADEIYNDTNAQVDIIVAGVGTGGTISGCAKRLKELKPEIRAVAIEPESSPMISKGFSASHKIQGIGANFVPKNYDSTLIDEVITIKDEDAIEYTKLLAKKEGIFAGISSGAVIKGAINLAEREENKDKTIVAILPDSGCRYLSMIDY